jgi:predicted SprT family Zn-dependent metalloprotease
MIYRAAAQVLCNATESIVAPIMAKLAYDKSGKTMHPISTRVGAGKSTHHKLIHQAARPFHEITYGEKMVYSKRYRSAAEKWLTGREIVNKGYYKGKFTLTRVLAHTVLHEAGHALQVHIGGRQRGSVHNEAFYSALDMLHEACGAEVLEYVERQLRDKGLLAEFLPESASVKPKKTFTYRVGQEIVARFRGRENPCKIQKINPKRLSVIVTGGPLLGSEFFIPPTVIVSDRPVAGGPVEQNIPMSSFAPQKRGANEVAVSLFHKNRVICLIQKANPKMAIALLLSGPEAGKKYRIPYDLLLDPTDDEIAFAKAVDTRVA